MTEQTLHLNSVSGTEPKMLSLNLETEVKLLRDRLHRRNIILDSVRHAYHRDVVLIQTQMQKTDIPKGDEHGLNERPFTDSTLSSSPSSVAKCDYINTLPSIDLRSNLPLFAPHECELLIRPCHFCGGQLELIHNESWVIFELKELCAELQSNARNLRFQASRSLDQARVDRKKLNDVKTVMTDMQNKAHHKFLKLEDALSKSKDQNENLCSKIEEVEADKEHMKKALKELQIMRLKVQDLERDIEIKGKVLEENGRQINRLECEKKSLCTNESNLKDEIDKRQKEANAMINENALLKSELLQTKEILEVQTNETKRIQGITNEKEEESIKLKGTISELRNNHSILMAKAKEEHNSIIDELKSDLRIREKENRSYEKRIGDALKEMKKREMQLEKEIEKQEEKNLSSSPKQHSIELDCKMLNERVAVANDTSTHLIDQILAFIKSFYGHCTVRGDLLHGKNMRRQTNDEKIEDVVKILERLTIVESEECSSKNDILKQKNVCSKLFSYLLDRDTADFELMKKSCNQKISQKETAMRKIKQDASLQVRDMKRRCDDKVRGMKKELKESTNKYDEILKKYQVKCSEHKRLHVQISTSMNEVIQVKRDLVNLHEISKKQQNEKIIMEENIRKWQRDIHIINTASLKMRADLFTSNTEIETKNEEIKKLRQNLKYALAMYENKVEEERERLETNKDKGIQNIPSLLEKSCQVDFVQMKNNVSSSMDVNRLLCGGAKDMKNKLNRYASQSRASLIARRCGV